MGRIITRFPAKEGERYQLRFDVLEDGSKLDACKPRLKVAVDLFALDGYYIAVGVLQILYLTIAGFGILLSVVCWFLWSRNQSPRRLTS
jgi:hypothetical protein